MVVVLDTSVAVAWAMQDEESAAADAALDAVIAEGAIVPALWHWEVANALLMSVRRGRVAAHSMKAALDYIGTLPIETEADAYQPAWTNCLAIAERQNLTAYDAAFVELAARRGLRLTSIDRELVAGARAEGVMILGEAA